VIDGDQKLVRNSDHSAFVTAASLEPIIFLAKVTILLAGCGEGRLDQR
jgi:hypothetical protein